MISLVSIPGHLSCLVLDKGIEFFGEYQRCRLEVRASNGSDPFVQISHQSYVGVITMFVQACMRIENELRSVTI